MDLLLKICLYFFVTGLFLFVITPSQLIDHLSKTTDKEIKDFNSGDWFNFVFAIFLITHLILGFLSIFVGNIILIFFT